jgi:hypothetical protein
VATATPRGTLAVHSLRTARGHAPRRAPAVAAGLEVSRRNTFQDLPGPTSPLRVASTCRSLSPVPSVAWPSPSSKLHTPGACGRTSRPLGCYRLGSGFSLVMLTSIWPQHRHDLFWRIPLDSHDPFSSKWIFSRSTQISPVRSEGVKRVKLHVCH